MEVKAATTRHVAVRRTHDAEEIERILRADAFDAPIPYFTDSLLRTAVRTLLAPSDRVYFAVADLDGIYAGFALGHTLGPTFWRAFARQQFWRHPMALASVSIRLKIALPLSAKLTSVRSDRPVPTPTPPPVAGAVIPRIDRPFAWTDHGPDIGQLDQLFVSERCRGLGVGSTLLQLVTAEMALQNVSLVEAHVDSTNQASLRAFLKAGWSGFQTRDGDYYLSYRPVESATEAQ